MVEKQHGKDPLCGAPDVEPVSPRIHVSLIDLPCGNSGVEWDVRACNSFEEDIGRWLRLRPNEPLPR